MKALFAFALIAVAATAHADPTCTKEPKSKWMPEAEMKKKIADAGYKVKVFKTTKTGCYEIYGHDKDGKKAEVYFNPVDGSVVKQEIGD